MHTKERRNGVVAIRVSNEERAIFEQFAREERLDISTAVRQFVLKEWQRRNQNTREEVR